MTPFSLQSSDLSLIQLNLTRQENVATRPSAEIKRHVTYVDSLSLISRRITTGYKSHQSQEFADWLQNQSLRLRPPPFCFSLFTLLHSLTILSLSLSRIWSYIHSLPLNSQSLNQFPEVASSISVLFIQTVWSIIHRILLAFMVSELKRMGMLHCCLFFA